MTQLDPETESPAAEPDSRSAGLSHRHRNIVLVGLMGAGKTTIGKRLARRLGWRFVDADDEIERAAGCSISEIFERFGEAEFRAGEARVIARITQQAQQVIATGGGAFVNADSRAAIAGGGTSVWLNADLDLLVARTARTDHRPLLQGVADRRAVLSRLLEERRQFYQQADLTVDSMSGPPDVTVDKVIDALARQ